MTNEEIAVKLAETDARSKSNQHRIDKLEEESAAIQSLAQSAAVTATELKSIGTKVDKIDSKVEALEAKPGKRWDGLVEKLLYAVAGAFAAWLLGGAAL